MIVSLKEGLFQNANVLYKVQFLDNRSQVKRFQIAAAEPSRQGNAHAGGQGGRRGRKKQVEEEDDEADEDERMV